MNIEAVPFYGDIVYAIEHDGEPYISMKSVIENMGLDWGTQFRKLTGNSVRWGVVILTTPSGGGDQAATCIPLRKLAGFLATINYKKVDDKLRGKILSYQNECDDALWQYWTRGRVTNPRRQIELPASYADALRALAEEVEQNERLELQIKNEKPMVEFAKAIEDSSRSVEVGAFAKVLNNSGIRMGRNRLYKMLRKNLFLMSNNLPYQNHIDNGNFIVIERTRESDNGPVPYFVTRISGKGQIAIERKLSSLKPNGDYR